MTKPQMSINLSDYREKVYNKLATARFNLLFKLDLSLVRGMDVELKVRICGVTKAY